MSTTVIVNSTGNSPTPVRASKIPTFNGTSPSTIKNSPVIKRRTKMSDLLARLSSTTASSRAKADTSNSPGRSFVSVFRSRNSIIQPPQQQLQHQTPGKKSQTSPLRSSSLSSPSGKQDFSRRLSSPGQKQSELHHRTTSLDTDESAVFPQRTPHSPPPPRPPTRMISRDRPIASSGTRLSDFKRYSVASSATSGSTATTRRTSYTPATSTNESIISSSTGTQTRASSFTGSITSNVPPSAPLPPSQGNGGTSSTHPAISSITKKESAESGIVVTRPGSRQRIVKRPGSRVGQVGGINPVFMRIQNSRVEELKSKIYELEDVLQSEKAEREAYVTKMEHIKSLESILAKERYEKEMLVLKLKTFMQNAQTATISGPSSPNIDGSDSATLADDERIKYNEIRISQMETVVMEQDINTSVQGEVLSSASSTTDSDEKDDRGLLGLQTELSVLKSENNVLKREKDNYQNAFKNQEEEIRTIKTRLQKLEPEYASSTDKLKENEIKLAEYKDRATTLESQISNKDVFIKEKLLILGAVESNNRDLDTKIRDLDEKLEITIKESERFRIERDDLQRQVNGFLASRKQTEKQITNLERDNRRAKRLITALETSLQDLKISLEEKAMENDELNRSILKVMEQANETIEGAKRHSVRLTSPPLGSDRRSSIDTLSASSTPYLGYSPDVSRNSITSSRFSRTSDTMSPSAIEE